MDFAPAIVEKLREQAERHREITESLSDPAVASDPKRFPALLRERGALEKANELWLRLEALIERRREGEAILAEDGDPELVELARDDLVGLEDDEVDLDAEIRSALVRDEDEDRDKIIVEIRAGTGGDEATLFAHDLFKMYTKYIESRRWKVDLLSASSSEVGGVKEIVFGVKGAGCWRILRLESGGHRVQRVPTTESQGRIHTSAATVAVLAEAEAAEVEVEDGALRIDTMRSSGPGGQNVNKVESGVRITHVPTGTVVQCQDEKSQAKNKAKAMRILRSRLLDAERQRLHAERAAERKSQVGSGDRSARIRTYNFPQNRVTDHRLGENFSLEQVIAGKLDALLDSLEAMERDRRIREL